MEAIQEVAPVQAMEGPIPKGKGRTKLSWNVLEHFWIVQATPQTQALQVYSTKATTTGNFKFDAQCNEMGASANAAACYKAHTQDAVGIVGVRLHSKDHEIHFCNQRSLEALGSAGLVTAHNTAVYNVRRDGRRPTGMLHRLGECTSTRAPLEKNKEAMAAVVAWYGTSLQVLADKGNMVFYTGKWCTNDPVHSGHQQFSPLLNLHICKRLHDYPTHADGGCLSATQHTEDGGLSTHKFQSGFPRQSGYATCTLGFDLPQNQWKSTTVQILLQRWPNLLLLPHIMTVLVDNIYNERSVRQGPHPVLGILHRAGVQPAYNCRNVQWPSYDGQRHVTPECRVYVAAAP
jgi:hypothetical protein